jgi:hypothetical protein
MASGLSGQNLEIGDVFNHYADLSASLRLYFSASNPDYDLKFAGESEASVEEALRGRLAEAEMNYTLTLLASLEASFKVDYLLRCKLKRKDPVSRALRLVYKRKKERASLENDILRVWKENTTTVPSRVIGDMIGAFDFRNWLAHGRYWVPKFGRRYDFFSVYSLVAEVLNSFHLEDQRQT